MRRALQLARLGEGHVSPNPMVGCVIVSPQGIIAGEGWHRRYGEGHAEVNAVSAVKDRRLLRDATVYVTLEPCSHYGKTPPCADMLASLPIARVVAGMVDPDPRVSGRGLARLRESGKEVSTGVLERECNALNRHFLTAQRLRRPYITLKWACDALGMTGTRRPCARPLRYSTPTGEMWVHRERTRHDAIMVSARTAIADNPRLASTLWPGDDPLPVVAGDTPLPSSLRICSKEDLIRIPHTGNLHVAVSRLFERHRVTSLLVEGGAALLQAFIDQKLYDEIRRESSPHIIGGDIPSAATPPRPADMRFTTQGNMVEVWYRE